MPDRSTLPIIGYRYRCGKSHSSSYYFECLSFRDQLFFFFPESSHLINRVSPRRLRQHSAFPLLWEALDPWTLEEPQAMPLHLSSTSFPPISSTPLRFYTTKWPRKHRYMHFDTLQLGRNCSFLSSKEIYKSCLKAPHILEQEHLWMRDFAEHIFIHFVDVMQAQKKISEVFCSAMYLAANKLQYICYISLLGVGSENIHKTQCNTVTIS